MNRGTATALLERLHRAQNEFYAGGGDSELRELLALSITWTVPGNSAIAGVYRGIDEVFAYFRRRRELAKRTFQIEQRDVLVGTGDRIAALNDGTAENNGVDHHWSTVGLYELIDGKVAACWLLPLDLQTFDAIWSR